MKIIVADDHVLFREGLRLVAKQLGDDVTLIEAGDHDSTLKLASQNPDADLILLDLNMPGRDPIEAIATMLTTSPTLPIVVLSASEDLQDVRRALNAGAMGFIPKNESLPVILNALRLVLAGGIYMPPMLMRPSSSVAETDASITPRQREVLEHLANGLSSKEIARKMSLSEATIKAHLAAIFRSLNVNNRTEAVSTAAQRGLLSPNALRPA